MGFLSSIFGRDEVEKRLVDQRASALRTIHGVAITYAQAKQQAREHIALAKQESRRFGTDTLPRNYGDLMLSRAATDTRLRRWLEALRDEGVVDSDIQWWWNKPDYERRFWCMTHDALRARGYSECVELTGSKEAGLDKLRMTFPLYGDGMYGSPPIEAYFRSPDRPLPYELMGRVSDHALKCLRRDWADIKSSIPSFSSYNAFVRAEISAGRL